MKPEALNKKAIQIINRVRDKLTGEYVRMFSAEARTQSQIDSTVHRDLVLPTS